MSSLFFSPITVGSFDLPNRIVMAPMTRSRSDDEGLVPSFAADYHAQRADAALIISEATNISPQAVGYALTPGIWSDQPERPASTALRSTLHIDHGFDVSHPRPHSPAAPRSTRP